MKCIEEEDIRQLQRAQKPGKPGKVTILARIIGNIIFGLLIALVLLLVASLVYVKAVGGPPSVAGHRMYIVLSGSMNPAFDMGSLAFVKPTAPEYIKSGDIITYRGLGDGEQYVSHRVLGVNETEAGITFTTKGDANEVADPNPVKGENLVGKVNLAIPYLGYFMEYTKTKQGILLLVIVPALILIGYESVGLLRSAKAKSRAKPVQCEPKEETDA